MQKHRTRLRIPLCSTRQIPVCTRYITLLYLPSILSKVARRGQKPVRWRRALAYLGPLTSLAFPLRASSKPHPSVKLQVYSTGNPVPGTCLASFSLPFDLL
ncbi:hypothetical protein DFH07DRAFT_1060226, partial [Mycena maculata]